MSSSSATILTGDGSSVDRERPRGRSGCVTTPTTSYPSPISARRGGVAKFAVVFRLMFAGYDDADELGILVFLVVPLAQRLLPFEKTEMIEKKLAMQMVDLVLHADAEEFGAFDLLHRAVDCLGLHDDARCTDDIAVDLGDRQTPFFPGELPLALDDLWIDQRILRALHLDDGDALTAPDLRCRETNAARGVHRLEHVGDELLQLLGHDLDALRFQT
jgi:hypothetical protein